MLRVETDFIQSDLRFSHWDPNGIMGITTESYSSQFVGSLTVWRSNAIGTVDEVFSAPMPVGGVRCVESSEHQSFVLTAHTDAMLRLWSLNEPEHALRSFKYHKMGLEDVAWSPFDGDSFVSASKDTSWAMWALTNDESPVVSKTHDAAMPILGVAYHPQNPALLITAPLDGCLELWNLDDTRRVYTLAPPQDVVFSSMSLNRYDENLLAVANEAGFVSLWDLRNVRQPATTFQAHAAPVADVKFSPHDEHLFGTAGADGVFHIWHTGRERTTRCLRSFRTHALAITCFDWSVHSLGLAADAASDYSLFLWNTVGDI
eukprot:TRINITY_DN50_c0_g1_i1.p1 TRINITY_DN50_c0_g1~~TRINITY_DN50_c0_g1_i1.p1  ORF type:complete len:317 (-),score=44.99 TRINITY_DN50_c0_g1_i1:699-1649(-)